MEKKETDLLIFDETVEMVIDMEDIENQTKGTENKRIYNKNTEKINTYFIKHKFIEKVCSLTKNKLLINFYLDFFDNYKTNSPQVILFINDLKRFLENNNNDDSTSLTNMCNGNLFNSNTINLNSLYNSVNNITIGNILSLITLTNANNFCTVVINKSYEYGRSIIVRSYSIFIYFIDWYREYSMFGNKELVSLCMRLDFSNQDVCKFGQDVVNL